MNNDKQKLLHELLIECLLMDLEDPTKCTPGLYQVVRGVINDNKESVEIIPTETMEFLANKLSDAIPFKKDIA